MLLVNFCLYHQADRYLAFFNMLLVNFYMYHQADRYFAFFIILCRGRCYDIP